MPYYRITIFLKNKKKVQGIRFFQNQNIDNVTVIARAKAKEYFQDKVVDIEAAMLSNHCSAVKKYQENRYKTAKKDMWVEWKNRG